MCHHHCHQHHSRTCDGEFLSLWCWNLSFELFLGWICQCILFMFFLKSRWRESRKRLLLYQIRRWTPQAVLLCIFDLWKGLSHYLKCIQLPNIIKEEFLRQITCHSKLYFTIHDCNHRNNWVHWNYFDPSTRISRLYKMIQNYQKIHIFEKMWQRMNWTMLELSKTPALDSCIPKIHWMSTV